VTNARKVAQLTETLKQKVQAKAQTIRGYEKRKPRIVRIRCLKKILKIVQKLEREEYRGQRTSLYGRSRDLLEVTMGRKTQHNERTEWIRLKERRKISRKDWKPIQITEITLYWSNAYNW
jgi:hypothetical protein